MNDELLLFLQDVRLSSPDPITTVMLAITSPLFYLVMPMAVSAFVFWCVDKHNGEWMLMNMVAGMFIGHFLKDAIRNPRPWVSDDRIVPEEKALKGASGYSTPSGHTVECVTGYGSLMMVFRRGWVAAASCAFITLVMFSRLFLGVHTLLDVLTGALVAIVVMMVNRRLLDISHADDRKYWIVSTTYIAAATIVTVIWTVTADDSVGLTRYCGLMFGTLIGRCIEHRYIGLETRDLDAKVMATRFMVGGLTTAILFAIPCLLLDGGIGYTIGGFMAAMGIFCISPLIMKRLL